MHIQNVAIVLSWALSVPSTPMSLRHAVCTSLRPSPNSLRSSNLLHIFSSNQLRYSISELIILQCFFPVVSCTTVHGPDRIVYSSRRARRCTYDDAPMPIPANQERCWYCCSTCDGKGVCYDNAPNLYYSIVLYLPGGRAGANQASSSL